MCVLPWYGRSMASMKVTITLDEQLARSAKELAPGGNLSAYIARLVRNAQLRAELEGSPIPAPSTHHDEVERDLAQRYGS